MIGHQYTLHNIIARRSGPLGRLANLRDSLTPLIRVSHVACTKKGHHFSLYPFTFPSLSVAFEDGSFILFSSLFAVGCFHFLLDCTRDENDERFSCLWLISMPVGEARLSRRFTSYSQVPATPKIIMLFVFKSPPIIILAILVLSSTHLLCRAFLLLSVGRSFVRSVLPSLFLRLLLYFPICLLTYSLIRKCWGWGGDEEEEQVIGEDLFSCDCPSFPKKKDDGAVWHKKETEFASSY